MLTWRTPTLRQWLTSDRGSSFVATVERIEAIAHSIVPLQLYAMLGFLDLGDRILLFKAGSGVRLFATCADSATGPVLILLTAVGHDEYDRMNADVGRRNDRLRALIDADELAEHLAAPGSAGATPAPPPLPAAYAGWLRQPASMAGLFTSDVTVAESPEVHAFLVRADEADRRTVFALAGRAVRHASVESSTATRHPTPDGHEVQPHRLLLDRLSLDYVVSGSEQGMVVHLIDVGADHDGRPIPLRALVIDGDESPRDAKARAAARCYPAACLGDEPAWLGRLELKPDADPCLPLSEEELLILDRFAHASDPTADGHRLPLFLDGPAGSGKSTLLALLAAGLIETRLREPESFGGGVLHLTYSAALAKAARTRVEALLRFHFGRQPHEIAPILEAGFATTEEFFRSLLPTDRAHLFAPERKVRFRDFSSFMVDPRRIPEAVSVPPELAWYVVRTFLKGFASPDAHVGDSHPGDGVSFEPFTSSEFNALPEQRRDNVTPDEFDLVHDRVFKPYLQWQAERRLWDDQDLALAALPHAVATPDSEAPWMAVICDEAQDLTRAELRVLVRSLGSTGYDLRRQASSVVLPMLFAADPAQTVNPSGFTWAGFTSSFHDESELLLGPSHAVHPKLTHLKRNYRSDRQPIAVADAIQEWRRRNLRLPVSSTDAWTRSEGAVHRHVVDSEGDRVGAVADALHSAVAVIVPSHEGGELDYVRGDPILRSVFAEDISRDEAPPNVYSPMAAKGREWDRVALYGFGRRFTDVWHTDGRHEGHRRTAKETDFTLNGLYVAATRARHSIHFFDDAESDDALWSVALANHIDEAPAIDRSRVTLDDLASSADDRRREAEIARRRGIETQDAAELRRAAAFWASTGDEPLAARALVWATFFETDVDRRVSVLDEFDAVDDMEAFESFAWRTGSWSYLSALPIHAGIAPCPSIRRRGFGRLLNDEPLELVALVELGAALTDPDSPLPRDPTTIRGCHRFLQAVLEAVREPGVDVPAASWDTLAGAAFELSTVAEVDAETALQALAWVHAAAGNDADARSAARNLDLTPADQRAFEAQLLRAATGLWFATDDDLIGALDRLDERATTPEDRDHRLAALTIASLSTADARARARAAPRAPANDAVSTAMISVLTADLVERERAVVAGLDRLVDTHRSAFSGGPSALDTMETR